MFQDRHPPSIYRVCSSFDEEDPVSDEAGCEVREEDSPVALGPLHGQQVVASLTAVFSVGGEHVHPGVLPEVRHPPAHTQLHDVRRHLLCRKGKASLITLYIRNYHYAARTGIPFP